MHRIRPELNSTQLSGPATYYVLTSIEVVVTIVCTCLRYAVSNRGQEMSDMLVKLPRPRSRDSDLSRPFRGITIGT